MPGISDRRATASSPNFQQRTTVERLPTSHRRNDRMSCATTQSIQAINSPCHLFPGSGAGTAARTVCCWHFSGQSRGFFENIAAVFLFQGTPHPAISGATPIAGHFSGRPHFGRGRQRRSRIPVACRDRQKCVDVRSTGFVSSSSPLLARRHASADRVARWNNSHLACAGRSEIIFRNRSPVDQTKTDWLAN